MQAQKHMVCRDDNNNDDMCNICGHQIRAAGVCMLDDLRPSPAGDDLLAGDYEMVACRLVDDDLPVADLVADFVREAGLLVDDLPEAFAQAADSQAVFVLAVVGPEMVFYQAGDLLKGDDLARKRIKN
jgi:hypothetical protein